MNKSIVGAFAVVGSGIGFEQIKFSAILSGALKVAHARKQGVARLLAAKPVQRAVRENALKQHGQFARGLVSVMLGQLEHAVLNDVQGRFLIADVVDRALESALFYTFEEFGKFLFSCQEESAREGRCCHAKKRGAARRIRQLSH